MTLSIVREFPIAKIGVYNTATAFSPTDALPLTHRAKLLMMLESLISLLTLVMVVARAVNVLP